MTSYEEILGRLQEFEIMRFRSDPELKDALAQMTYDAVVALLKKLTVESQESK